MKTQEYWEDKLGRLHCELIKSGSYSDMVGNHRAFIAEIQRDAVLQGWRDGMTDAASIIQTAQIHQGDQYGAIKMESADAPQLVAAILAAREAKLT